MDAQARGGAETARHREGDAGPPELGRLRVALVHDWLTGRRGGEKCLEVLCEAFPAATLHTLIHRRSSAGPTIERMRIRTSPLQRLPGVHRHYRKLLPIMPLAARAWRLDEVDLVVSLSHCVAKAVKVPPGVPHVCYCFTPMRYAWDGRASYLDGWSGRPITRAVAGWTLDRLRAWDRATAAGVSHFVAISETVRQRIAGCYGRDSVVIQPPVDTEFYTPTGSRREAFYLCVSALVPYKRIDHAIRACAASGRELVVIGEGPDRARLEGLAGGRVRFLGWQPDEVVRDHLRRCRALLFPGVEDFGIVPIEALACGSPVIALGVGGAAETVDDAVGRVFHDHTSDGLQDALDDWEARGCPHDPAEARRRAESLAAPVFRRRLLGFLADVVAGRAVAGGIPAPHVPLRAEPARSRPRPRFPR
jgi:glycosyltransferase involved in cell wall biosynthesis